MPEFSLIIATGSNSYRNNSLLKNKYVTSQSLWKNIQGGDSETPLKIIWSQGFQIISKVSTSEQKWTTLTPSASLEWQLAGDVVTSPHLQDRATITHK